MVMDTDSGIDHQLFSLSLKSGFRRSGKIVYRPYCRNCNACVSVRIPASEYLPNRAQRRCYKRNRDVYTTMVPAGFSEEHFELFCRYQSWRHSGDNMDHNDPDRYRESMVDSPIDSVFLEFRINERLVGVSVCDLPDDGMSAVYTYFDPAMAKRSLGTYAIMKQIEYVREVGLDWLYLGYWINGCSKMSYKSNFRPLFGFINQEWRILNS